YPNSESSVAYIGETGNLSERIAVHRYHARTCKANKNGSIYFPRYEWVAARGGACLYSPAPESAANTKTTKEMETKLLQAFESLHYTIPVANMQRGKGCYAPATETVTTTV
ncbi:hypothetical protein AB0N17_36835, partial [Streptomyces sp. NPDC051133]|uniref:hypothetical protein n=1 Tax=Streptomyces sp. NPDC051133 TaxID=3155521 RepID=UPI00343FA855